MTAKYFVDTTILVWARDSFDPKRHAIARAVMETLWKEGSGRISHQVLNEYYVVVTRKLNPGLSPDEARADIRDLLSWNPVAPDREMFEGAWTIQDRYGLSWWDSLIVSAARKTMSDFLLTEDLQHGMKIGDLTIRNPFLDDRPPVNSPA
jgi:predicted nucleic acid-binding protein